MADEGLRIVNTVDNTQVEKAFSSVRKQIINSADTAQQQGKKIDKAFDNIAVSANATSDTIKKRLIEVQNSVNSLSAQIIAKRAVIRDIQDDVKTLSEAYKKAVKNGSSNKNSILGDLNAAKRQLSEEKYALGLLNDEKAKATLRTRELKAQLEMSKKTVDDNTLSVNMLTKAFAALGGTIMLKSFISQVVQTRGEFQQLEVAFKTMLGSAEKANDLMQQLTKTAAITPFDLKGVTDGAKQLLAYGVKAEEVNDVLIHLGDIAAGLSLPLGDLVYLYGTTLTQGRMYTQDLRQFMGRGIPLAEELAKQFGVTKDKVGELVTAGKVGADEFKKAIMSMSSEGGKFGGLMEAQSKTITGQISNIEDAIDVMFNNIGQKSEGIINKSLGVVSSLVENYENVGKTILSVIAVYGTYKAAVMTVCAIQKLQAAGIAALTVTESIHYGWLVLMEKAQALLNKTMLANPYVLAATALVALIVVMARATDESRVMTQATEAYNAAKEKAIEKEQKHAEEMNKLIDVATDESNSTDNRIKALNRLEQEYPAIFSKYGTEAEKLEHIRDIKKEIAEYDASTSMSNVNYELETVNAQIDALEKIGVGQYETTFMYGTPQRRWMGGRTDQEEAQLQFLMTKRAELEGLVKKDNAENYLANLTGVSDEELAQEIQVRKDLLAEITLTGNKSGKVASGGAQGEYSADELKGQMQIFQSEQNRRNEKRYSPSEIKNNLAKELAVAKKALADFDKSSTKLTIAEAEKERKRLQDAVSDAEKKYKAAGGNEKKDEKDAVGNAKYDETRRKQELAEKRAAEDMELSTRQAVINAREDSTEKILEQYDLDFEKQKLAIERGYEDLKQKKIDNARSLFEANPANKGKVFDESSVDTSYTEAETANYNALLAANEQAHKKSIEDFHKKEQEQLDDLLDKYADYNRKKEALEKQFSDDKAEIEKHANQMTQTQYDNLISEWNKQYVKALEELNQQYSDIYKVIFQDPSKMTKVGLENALANARKELQRLISAGSSSDVIKPVYDQVVSLQRELENFDTSNVSSDLNGIIKQLIQMREIRKQMSEYEEGSDIYNQLLAQYERAEASFKKSAMVTSAGLLASNLKNAAGQMRELASAIGDADLEHTAEILEGISTTIEGAVSGGLSTGSWIGALVGGLASLGDYLIQAGNQAVLATKEAELGLVKFQNRLELLKYQLNSDDFSSIFGKDEFNFAVNAIYKYDDAIKKFVEKSNALKDVMVKIERSQWFVDWNTIYEKTTTYSALSNYDIWDKDGILDVEKAKAFVQTNKDLNEEQKEQINNVIEMSEAYETAKQAVDEYLKSITESMGKDIADIVFDSVINGANAWDLWQQKGSDAILSLGKQMIAQMAVDEYFSQYEGELNDAIRSGNVDSLKDVLGKMYSGSDEMLKLLQESAQAWIDSSEEAGFKFDYSQSASSNGFNAMNQEMGAELNGRFTAIQIVSYELRDLAIVRNEMIARMEQQSGGVKTSVDAITDAMATANIHLSDIAKYSKNLIGIGDKLDTIIDNTKHL